MTDTDEDTTLFPSIAFAIVGYPGAGKSTAGEIAADYMNAIFIETGDIVRSGATDHFDCDPDSLSSDELGDYSTMRRETDGGDYVAQDVIDTLSDHDDFPHRPVVICGMRDTEVPTLFEWYFDVFATLWVHAPFETRLQRLQDRGRQDEGEFTKADLAARDGRESMWGTSDVSFIADHRISNDGSLDDLELAVKQAVGDTLCRGNDL